MSVFFLAVHVIVYLKKVEYPYPNPAGGYPNLPQPGVTLPQPLTLGPAWDHFTSIINTDTCCQIINF